MPYEDELIIRYQIGPSSFYDLDTSVTSVRTDHVANAVILDNADIKEWVHYSGAGRLQVSPKTLRLLIHEATHHAAMMSRLGVVLSALWTSVAGRAYVETAKDKKGALSLHERDHLVANWVYNVFEPIFEGLSLYAEHDTISSTHDLASHTILHAYALSIDPSGDYKSHQDFGKKTNGHLNSTLRKFRSKRYWIEHKAHLLTQPMFGDHRSSAYLLGYLTMKRMFYDCIVKSGSPIEPDLFLYAASNHWLQRKSTASLLLRVDDLHVYPVQNTISELAEKFQDICEERYQIFDRKNFQTLDAGAFLGGDMLGFDDALLGLRTAAEKLHFFVPEFQNYRPYLRLGFIRVKMKLQEGRTQVEVFTRDTNVELLTCDVLNNSLEPGVWPGVLEFVRSYNGEKFCMCLLGASGLVAVKNMMSGIWNSDEFAREFAEIPSIEQIDAAAQSAELNPKVFCWDQEGYSDIHSHVIASSIQLRDHMFSQVVFPNADKKEREKLISKLSHEGLSFVFENDLELMDFANLTLQFGGEGQDVGLVAKKIGVSESELASKISNLNSLFQGTIGFSPFKKLRGRIISLA